LNEIAEVEDDEEEAPEVPGWVKVGALIEMNVGDDEWARGSVKSIEGGAVTVEDEEGEEYDVEDFDDIRPVRAKRGKSR